MAMFKKVTYDKEAKVLYIYLVDKIADGEAVQTDEVDSTVLVDKDKTGKPLGIEIIGLEL